MGNRVCTCHSIHFGRETGEIGGKSFPGGGCALHRRKKAGEETVKKTADGGKISRMALSNLGRNKGKTVIVIVSLSLAIVLLNSIFTFTNAFDMDKYLANFVSSDFVIANAKYFNSEYSARKEELQESNLTESFIEACEEQEGFEKGGRIYADNRSGRSKDF